MGTENGEWMVVIITMHNQERNTSYDLKPVVELAQYSIVAKQVRKS
jgi:hypothetical protein